MTVRKMFVEQLLVLRSYPVLLLASYKMFVKELLELHNCPVLVLVLVVEVVVCKMFEEELQPPLASCHLYNVLY